MHDKLSFLVVEDEENIAIAIKAILSKNFDSDVDIVYNGEDAIYSMAAKQYDLVISDWNMPKKTGGEFLSHVREDERTRHVPFIMLTARSDRSSVLHAIESGVSDYLHKPFDKKTLIEKVHKLIDHDNDDEAGTIDNREEIQRIIGCVHTQLDSGTVAYPAVPEMYSRLHALSESFDIGIDDIAATLRADDAICINLIHLSNTIYYRGFRENSSLEQAIVRIGNDNVKSYVLMFNGHDLFSLRVPQFHQCARALWYKSLATARCAQTLAKRGQINRVDRLFDVGFLHDIGAIWLLRILEQFDGFRAVYNKQILLGVIDALSVPLSVRLLSSWHMPAWIINCAQQSLEKGSSREVKLVKLAGKLVHKLGYGIKPWRESIAYLQEGAELGLDLQPYLLESLLKDVEQFVNVVNEQIL